jgi:hypothetical protein
MRSIHGRQGAAGRDSPDALPSEGTAPKRAGDCGDHGQYAPGNNTKGAGRHAQPNPEATGDPRHAIGNQTWRGTLFGALVLRSLKGRSHAAAAGTKFGGKSWAIGKPQARHAVVLL